MNVNIENLLKKIMYLMGTDGRSHNKRIDLLKKGMFENISTIIVSLLISISLSFITAEISPWFNFLISIIGGHILPKFIIYDKNQYSTIKLIRYNILLLLALSYYIFGIYEKRK